MMQELAIFDFDGTLTRKDTFVEFAKFAIGKKKTFFSLFLFSPLLVAMKLHLIDNSWLKQRLFSFLYRGMPYLQFKENGKLFANIITSFENSETLTMLEEKQSHNAIIVIISASIYEWVQPWCELHNIDNVICTHVAVKNNLLTGIFSTPNCHGKEKVVRLKDIFGDLTKYQITACGDSRGDRELFAIADQSFKI